VDQLEYLILNHLFRERAVSLLKFVQQPAQAACQSADNSQRDVEPETLALCVDNFASDEPSD